MSLKTKKIGSSFYTNKKLQLVKINAEANDCMLVLMIKQQQCL
jgi:hypothetical protein